MRWTTCCTRNTSLKSTLFLLFVCLFVSLSNSLLDQLQSLGKCNYWFDEKSMLECCNCQDQNFCSGVSCFILDSVFSPVWCVFYFLFVPVFPPLWLSWCASPVSHRPVYLNLPSCLCQIVVRFSHILCWISSSVWPVWSWILLVLHLSGLTVCLFFF